MCKAYRQRSIWARIKLFSSISALLLQFIRTNLTQSESLTWFVSTLHKHFYIFKDTISSNLLNEIAPKTKRLHSSIVQSIFKERSLLPRRAAHYSKQKITVKPLLKSGCGDRIWTYDLRVMSPTSYRAAPPRVGSRTIAKRLDAVK